METKVTALAAYSDPTFGHSPHEERVANTGTIQSRIATGAIDQADLRLVIEEQAGVYIYKTVDRRTGETIAQYPREDILKLHDDQNYLAGDVIRAKA